MKGVLIVDDDLGFAFWLGQTLDGAGYESMPAKSIPDATLLLAELRVPIDVLVLNPALPGCAVFEHTLRSSKGDLKVICLTGDADPEPLPSADVWRSKPDVADELSRLEWLQVIQSLFANGLTAGCAGFPLFSAR